jgi:hypothetical protein
MTAENAQLLPTRALFFFFFDVLVNGEWVIRVEGDDRANGRERILITKGIGVMMGAIKGWAV